MHTILCSSLGCGYHEFGVSESNRPGEKASWGLWSSFRRNVCVFHIIASDMIVLTANVYSVLTTCLSLST